MSDIIQDAKQLLEEATPGPWSIDGAPHPGPDDELFIHPKDDGGAIARVQPLYADAELIAVAPELAQALAEETYEYAVQVKCKASKEWRLLSFKLPFITHKTTWFRSQSEAEHERQEQVSGQVNSRIVRRRVSPLEVIDE